MNLFFELDLSMLFAASVWLKCLVFDVFMPIITLVGNKGILWIIVAVVLFCNKKTRKSGYALALTILLCYIIGNVFLKELVMRPRPFETLGITQLLIAAPDGFSFPSGHATSSFAALCVLYATQKNLRIPAAIYAMLISFSRVYLFVHYPTDVLCGALLGIGCGYFVLYLLHQFKAHPPLYEYGRN
ncbi:MAG: phosphatase PAP2 family protein [Christensenellaceae bacterium]